MRIPDDRFTRQNRFAAISGTLAMFLVTSALAIFGMGYSMFPASSDQDAGHPYHKMRIYGNDVHLHVLYSTEPTIAALYVG
jgi:hypothetical protein